MSGNVLVVGSLNLDLVVSAPSIPRPGQTVLGTDFQMFPGGKGANQAVSAARQNAFTAMVGRIGRDEFGERLLESLHTSGVGTEFVAVDPDLSTGVAFICVDEAGENAIVVAPGANNGCAIEHLPGAIWEQTDVVLLQLEIPLGTVTKAAAYAREHEALVILDPAPPQVLPRDLLENVDILAPNSSEAAVLAGMDDPVTEANVQEVAEKLLSLGPKQVIVKLGADGAFLWGQYAKERVYGIPVESVDTTAAGDCYAGALGACLARGATLLEAARYANVAAAIAVTRKGAQSSMPTSSEVKTFIDKLK